MSNQVTSSGSEAGGEVRRPTIYWRLLASVYCGAVTLVSFLFTALSLYVAIAKVVTYTPHGAGYPCLVGYALALILPVLGIHFISWLIGLVFKSSSAFNSKIYVRLGLASFLASFVAICTMVVFC